MILKLATTLLHRTIEIRKLNNIIINRLQSPQPSMPPDKWRFNTYQDWKILEDGFDSVSLNIIPDNTLQALEFYCSLLGYFKEGTLQFIDITDNPQLTI